MRKREKLFLTFFIFFIISLALFLLNKTSPLSIPFGFLPSSIFQSFQSKEILILREENLTLRKQLVDKTTVERENHALSDQFATTLTPGLNLLVAQIIAMPSFVPGVTTPEYYIINKGSQDGVEKNQAVLYKDNIVGKATDISKHTAKIQLVTNTASSFTSKTLKTDALGVVKGQEGLEMIFGNVLLSEKLQVGDLIITHGEIDVKNIGYPPNLIVGEIQAVDKKSSSLFQSARVKSKLDFAKLSTVFVVLGYK